METLMASYPLPFVCSNHGQMLPWFPFGFPRIKRVATMTKARVLIRAPPLGFDYRTEMTEESRSAVEAAQLGLLDLVDEGRLVLVEKRRFGPVPEWRRQLVEPEAIWLVGTSHVSRKSVADVERVIRALKPDNVVVELCRSRAGIMYASKDVEDASLKTNMLSLGGTEFFGAVTRSIALGGQSAFALRLLLAVFSSKISTGAKRSFGDEFRSARKISEEVGAQIVLGDRPIEITLERAWNSLVWSEKLRLVISLFQGIISSSIISESNLKLESTEIDGGPFQLYQQLSRSYPSLLQPLVYERDTELKPPTAVKTTVSQFLQFHPPPQTNVILSLVDVGGQSTRNISPKDTLQYDVSSSTVSRLVLEEEQSRERQQESGWSPREGPLERRGLRFNIRPRKPAISGPRREQSWGRVQCLD